MIMAQRPDLNLMELGREFEGINGLLHLIINPLMTFFAAEQIQ